MIIGVGTDIVEINRVEKAVLNTSTFIEKVYTPSEYAYYESRNKKVETLAGIFAAKEAVSKALGTGFRGFGLQDIEIIPNTLGKPTVKLYNCAKEIGHQLGIVTIHVSISHCQTYATSFAVAEGGTPDETIYAQADAGNGCTSNP